MKVFLLNRIEKYYVAAGGKHKLSVMLGFTYTHVEMVMKRRAFSALERLYKICREKIDGVSIKDDDENKK